MTVFSRLWFHDPYTVRPGSPGVQLRFHYNPRFQQFPIGTDPAGEHYDGFSADDGSTTRTRFTRGVVQATSYSFSFNWDPRNCKLRFHSRSESKPPWPSRRYGRTTGLISGSSLPTPVLFTTGATEPTDYSEVSSSTVHRDFAGVFRTVPVPGSASSLAVQRNPYGIIESRVVAVLASFGHGPHSTINSCRGSVWTTLRRSYYDSHGFPAQRFLLAGTSR